MRDGEMRPEHAQPIEMRGLASAVEPNSADRLHFRLGDMAVQPDIELASEGGTAENERIRAMMRDRRRNGRPHLVAVEGPVAKRRADRGQGHLSWCETQFRDLLFERRR